MNTKNVVDSQQKIDRGFALAAVIQAIPLLLWVALLTIIGGFLILALWFNHSRLETFTSQVLLWLVRGLIAIGVILLIVALHKCYKVYHNAMMDLYERRAARAVSEKQKFLAESQRLKNTQLEARIELERQLPLIVKYAMEQGHNIAYDGKALKVENRFVSTATVGGGIAGNAMGAIAGTQQAGLLTSSSRPTLDDIIEATEPNSYKLPIGPSINTGEYIQVELPGKHIKVIGGTQMGKSSFAAFLIKAFLGTHDTQHLQIAVLDLEDRTGKLFNDDPHIMAVTLTSKTIPLHARSIEQVAEHLHILHCIMEYRYKLESRYGIAYVESLPRVLIYFEEFLYWKRVVGTRVSEETLERAYAAISGLSTRGLKVGMHLALFSQVDYAIDKELIEAMAQFIGLNVAFCVKPSAAQAAGFVSHELLKDNFAKKLPGRYVVESTGITDIGLTPLIDVNAELRALGVQQAPDMTLPEPQTGPIRLDGSVTVDAATQVDNAATQIDTEPTPLASYRKKRATYNDAVEVWNEVGEIGRPTLKDLLEKRDLECSDYLAGELLKAIKQRMSEQA